MNGLKRAKTALMALIGTSVFLSSCSETSNESNSSNELTVALSSRLLDEATNFLSDFAKDNPSLKLHVVVLEEEEILYRVRHDKLDCDLVFSSDLELILGNSSYFADLSSTEFASDYTGYIRDFLTTSDNKLYCLPSPGFLCPIAINMDLLSRYNLSFPTTFEEFKEFGSKANSYAYPVVSSYSSSEYYLDFFLRSTVPTFFSSTKGNLLFNEFASGQTSLSSSPYLDGFTSAVEGFRDLCNSSIFDFDSNELSSDAFFEGKAFALSLSTDFDFEEAYKEHGSSFSYSFVPNLGISNGQGWVCATSDFYVAALEKNYKGEKSKKIDSLLSYFSSIEGQKHFTLKEDGASKRVFSYLNEYTLSLDSHYSKIADCFEKGRVYIADRLTYVIKKNYSAIIEYAKGELTTGGFVEKADANFEINSTVTNSVLSLPGFERFGDDIDSSSQGEMANTIAKTLKSLTHDDVICIPESFVKYPVYNGKIYSSELDSVFDKELSLTPTRLKGSELKKALDLIFSLTKEATTREGINPFAKLSNVDISYPIVFASNAYLIQGAYKNNDAYYLNNKTSIDDDTLYRASLPTSFLTDNKLDIVSIGEAYNALAIYGTYLTSLEGEAK